MKNITNEPVLKRLDGNIYTALENPGKARYDLRARYYEWLVSTNWFNVLAWNTLPKNYTDFARDAIVKRSGNLIDAGCGGLSQTGRLYRETTNNCTLVDLSAGMLKVAEKRLADQNGKIPQNIKIVQGNAFDLPFGDGTFDTLCSFGTLHLFDDKQLYLDSILKTLKHGGHFYFLTMTNAYLNSRILMNFLRIFGEFGKVFSQKEYLALFPPEKYKVDAYMKGSVLFIKGKKL